MKWKIKVLGYKPKTLSWLAYAGKEFIDNIFGSSQNQQEVCRTRLGKLEARQGKPVRVMSQEPSGQRIATGAAPARASIWTPMPPSP